MASNKKVNMKVPANMVDQLEQYMKRLEMAVKPTIVEPTIDMDIDSEMEDVEREVGRVKDHRVNADGSWQFLIQWKGYRTSDWADDVDCNCEMAISKYLNGKGIRTAYLFCRVSTQEQATSTNTSLEAQESELRRAAGINDFARIRVYAISHSAYKDIPKTLKYIGEAALQGDAIYVWRVDRLSRNIIKYMSWLEDLNDRGVGLYSHQEEMYYSEKKLPFIQAVIDAQKEAALLGERIKMSYRLKRERGDEHVGGISFGKMYQRVLSTDGKRTIKKIVVDNLQEQEIIAYIRKSKKTSQEIVTELNKKGIKKRGRVWNKMMVFRLRAYEPKSKY